MPAPHARIAHPAHRRVRRPGRRIGLVHVHSAAADATCQLAAAPQVTRPDARVQPVFRVICGQNGIFHIVKPVDRDHRSKGFLAIQVHLRRYVGKDRRLEEVRTEVRPRVPSCQHGRALADGILNVRSALIELVLRNQRPDIRGEVERGAQTQRLRPARKCIHEAVKDAALHIEAFKRNAHLTRIGEAPLDRAVDGPAEVGVIQHDHRVLAPQFERALGQILAGLAGNTPAGFGAAGEA